MKALLSTIAILSLLAASACSQAASTPAALATALQSALDKGDFEATRQLAELDASPAQIHFFIMSMVGMCASEVTCTVTTEEVDVESRQRWKIEAERMNAQAPAADGVIKIATQSRSGGKSGKKKIPYAKVGAAYKLTSVHFTEAEFAALRAKSDQALIDEFFTKGVRDSNGESRTDWATAGTRLPADGGEAGKAFVARTKAMAAAIDAKDPDAAMHAGGELSTLLFQENDSNGEPIPLVVRKRILHVQSLLMLRDVKVKGGYQLGDSAVLIIEARDGIGWIVRGPILLVREGDGWDRAGDGMVSYPAAK